MDHIKRRDKMNDLKKIFNEIIYFREASSELTETFKDLKHNKHLCPVIERKLNVLLAAFERYKNKVHDIQGIHDKGTDVFIRQHTEIGFEFICIQIKSQDDLDQDGYLKDLKSQYFDSKNTYTEMVDYYIILCCDTSKRVYKDKVRNIAQVFSKEPPVHVVIPEFAISFYLMGSIQIDAIVKNLIGNEDIVVKETKKIFLELTPTEIALVVYFCFEFLFVEKRNIKSVEDILNIQFIKSIFGNTENHIRDWFFFNSEEYDALDMMWIDEQDKKKGDTLFERVNYDLEFLNYNLIDNQTGVFRINPEQVTALMATMLDGRVRYGYVDEDLLNYVFELSKPLKGFIE